MKTLKTLLAIALLRSVFAVVEWALGRVSARNATHEADEYAAA